MKDLNCGFRILLAGALVGVVSGCGGETSSEPEAPPPFSVKEGKWSTSAQVFSVKGDGPEVAMLESLKSQVSSHSMCVDASNKSDALLAALDAQGWGACEQSGVEPMDDGPGRFAATLTCTGGDGIVSDVVAKGGVYESGEGFSFGVVRTTTNPETGSELETGTTVSGSFKGEC